jgi:predicted TPR repeat methyltransferase
MTDKFASEPDARAGEIRNFFEGLWRQGDYWELETSEYDQTKYDREMALLEGRRFRNALELGCGAGAFTRRLLPACDRILGIDVAPTAIARALSTTPVRDSIEFRTADVIGFDPHPDGPWDVIVFDETIYYVGWRYSFFEIAWTARQLFEATAREGLLLMTNTSSETRYLHHEWILRAYRDVFVNAGYTLTVEDGFRGEKGGEHMQALIWLFRKE